MGDTLNDNVLTEQNLTPSAFVQFMLSGVDAKKFLQGQITCDVTKLGDHYQATAISNLKGRVAFGLWLKKITAEQFAIVVSQDLATELAKHIKKYGAFSKISLSEPTPIAPVIVDGVPSFSDSLAADFQHWQGLSMAQGNAWITKATQDLFQPQELRLHQRGGVDYDKGCYLGQEIIARLYFKASPKAWLHRVSGTGDAPAAGTTLGKVDVVNAIAINTDTDTGFEALVVARPEDIAASGLTALALPDALQQPVARQP